MLHPKYGKMTLSVSQNVWFEGRIQKHEFSNSDEAWQPSLVKTGASHYVLCIHLEERDQL